MTFFFLHPTSSCRLPFSLSSHLTPGQLVLVTQSFNPNKTPSTSPEGYAYVAVQQSSIDRVSDHCMRWAVHHAFRRWNFGFRTRIRLDSNSCVDGVFVLTQIRVLITSFFEFGHVVVDVLSSFPTRSPHRKYAWQQHTLIIDLPKNHIFDWWWCWASKRLYPLIYDQNHPSSVSTVNSNEEPYRFFFGKAGQLWTLNKQP